MRHLPRSAGRASARRSAGFTTRLAAMAAASAMVLAACSSAATGDSGSSDSPDASQADASQPDMSQPDASQPNASQSDASDGDDGSGESPAPSDETLTIGLGVALDTVDPAQQTTTTVQNVVDYGLETLVSFDQDGKIEPKLATEWELSDDGMTLTFQLQEGIEFHDGTPFNADAVVYSLSRLISGDIPVPIGAGFLSMEEIEAVDDSTVVIHMKQVDPDLLPNLSTTMASIFSPTSADQDGNKPDLIVHPVGTGPYAFTKWTKGTEVVYERVDDYWGDAPYYKTVDFKIIPEANSREAGLLAGQLDVIMNPPVTDIESLSGNSDVEVLKAPSDRSVFIAFNTTKAPFDNEKVRQALNYAVDTDSLIKNVVFDAVNKMDSPFPSSLSGYCEVGDYAYNPDKAKQLLADAGVKDLEVTLGTPTGRYLQDKQVTQAISGNLRDVGVTANVQTMDWPSYVTAMQDKDGPFDLHLLGWAPGALDGATQLQMFTTASIPPDGLNTSFYSDKKVDDMLDEANADLDETSRNATMCDIQKELWEQAPWIYLWSQTLVMAYSSDLEGMAYTPNEKFNTIGMHPAS